MHARATVLLATTAALGAPLATCGHTDGSVEIVALAGCRDPQTGYAARHVADLNYLQGSAWRMAADGEAPTVTIACAALPSGTAGQLALDTGLVTIDPVQAPGELAWTLVMLHELIHFKVRKGPHPERARAHLCYAMGDLGDPSLCITSAWWTHFDVMHPLQGGLGSSTSISGWSGETESVDVGDVPNFALTMGDFSFYQQAVAP